MNYRKLIVIPLALITLVVLFGTIFTSCLGNETMDIDERIDEFFSDVEVNKDGIWKNFHPDSTTREAGKDPSVFSDFPDTTYDYSFDRIGPTTKLTVSSNDGTYNKDIMTFIMKEDGSDYWMILKIDTNNDGTYEID